MATADKNTRGGKREGAGRPKTKQDRSPITVRISDTARINLDKITRKQSQSDAVEALLEGLSDKEIEKISKS